MGLLATIFSRYNIFQGVNFTILYNWLPTDIANVITTCIGILLVLAVLGLVRKFLLH